MFCVCSLLIFLLLNEMYVLMFVLRIRWLYDMILMLVFCVLVMMLLSVFELNGMIMIMLILCEIRFLICEICCVLFVLVDCMDIFVLSFVVVVMK